MKLKSILLTAAATISLATATMAQVPNYVPTNGLVGWWPFNGNANDESGNGNNGTVNGASLTMDRQGNANSAYSFNGLTNSISVSNNPSICPQTEISISFWFNLASYGNYSHFLSKRLSNSAFPYSSYAFGQVIPGQISPYGGGIATSNGSGNVNGDTLVLNAWSFICLTYNGQNITLYENGLYKDTSSFSGNLIYSNLPLYFGTSSVPGQFLNGKLDDIGIWNRALTVCEIQNLYASQLNSTFVNAGADQTICNGDAVTLSAINSLNYSWDNGVTDGVAFNPTATQDYTVSADSAGCLSTDVVTVTVNEHTTATQIQIALDSYTWPINSQTYTQSGTYTAVIPNTAGCDSTITLDLSLDFTGINEFSEDNLFTVFPNPAQSAINIKADNKLIGDVYTIYDNTGRVVLTGKLNSKDTTIELINLSGGIYMFSVGENMKQTFKVIKE